MEILNFLGRVNIAVNIVQKKYPGAILYEVQATPKDGQAGKATNFENLRIIFAGPPDPRGLCNSTIEIESCGWGEFSEPVFHSEPWCEDVVIKWPVKLDLADAQELKDKAGFQGLCDKLYLRNPLCYPLAPNPFYIFIMIEKGVVVFVDANTGKVTPEKMYRQE